MMLDGAFREAVSAIDAGDVHRLERLLDADPRLVNERLEAPGAWLREKVNDALDGFFARPYLLWFVAEDPVRNGRLPANIAEIAGAIIAAAKRHAVSTLQEQLDHALRLVSWSWIAREAGVQLALIDVLIDAGAQPNGNPDNALVNGNTAAAERLVERGARLTLATAACLGRWADVARLAETASQDEKQMALVLAALNGKAHALTTLLDAGADPDTPSGELYSHGTPLHHAVSSGSLDAVKVLVGAGAAMNPRDTAWDGTPLGWALHLQNENHAGKADRYAGIAAYLRDNRAQQ